MLDRMRVIDELAREQHGLVTLKQLLKVADEFWIRRQVQAGRLIRVAPRVYRVCGIRRTWETRALAAVLSSRTEALISHRSAAYLWGIAEHMPGIIDVTLPRHRMAASEDRGAVP